MEERKIQDLVTKVAEKIAEEIAKIRETAILDEIKAHVDKEDLMILDMLLRENATTTSEREDVMLGFMDARGLFIEIVQIGIDTLTINVYKKITSTVIRTDVTMSSERVSVKSSMLRTQYPLTEGSAE